MYAKASCRPRVFLEIKGRGVEGLMMGNATKEGLDFLYEIGFGVGEAHLTKTSEPTE